MKNDKANYQIRNGRTSDLFRDVTRPHKKRLSRYRIRKQMAIMEQILDDPQVMGL